MQRRRADKRWRVCGLVAILAMAAHTASAQDWPASRHDYQRTGRQPLASDIQVPAVRWSIPLGGGLSPPQWRIADINLDDEPEVISILGGAAIARRFDGTLVWASELLSLSLALSVADLDRNGRPEVWVGGSRAGLYALDGDTGAVLWQMPFLASQRLGSVFPLDVEGDGALELYVADSGCGMAGAGTGRIFHFDDGFPTPSAEVTLDVSAHGYWCGSDQDAADLDGDGLVEIIALSDDRVIAYDPATGEPRWTSPALGSFPFGRATTHAVDLDGDTRAEVVVLSNEPGTVGTAKRLLLLELDDSDQLGLRLSLDFDATDGGHQFVNPPVANLASGPELEIATSWFDPGDGRWRTGVLAGTALDGDPPLIELLDQALVALADVDGDDVAELVTIEAAAVPAPRFGTVTAFRLVSGATLAAEPVWQIEHASLATELDAWGRHRLAATLGDERPAPLALLIDADNDGRAESLVTTEADGTLQERGPIADAFAVTVRTVDGGVAVSRTDGLVERLDTSLQLINDQRPLDGQADLRQGAYLAAGLLARAGDPALLATVDPAGSAVVFALTEPPAALWHSPEVAVTSNPGLALPVQWLDPGGDTLAYRARDSSGALRLVLADDTTGAPTGGFDLASDGQTGLVNDVVPLRDANDGGAITALVQGLVDSGTVAISFAATDVATGDVLDFDLDRTLTGCWERPGTAWDLSGDGIDDFLTSQATLLRGANGATGQRIVDLGGSGCGVMTITDLDGAGEIGVIQQGALGAARRSLAMQVVWSVDGGLVHVPGAVASRDAEWMSLAMVRATTPELIVRDTESGDLLGTAVLAGGSAYPDLAAANLAGAVGGTLSAAISVDNLTGEGHAAFVVGSSDGWLYAVSAEDASLDWSINLRAAAGEPIAADLDGDGASEIAVPVGDGHIVIVDRASLAAPTYVYDTDSTFVALSQEEDVDVLFGATRLGANWGAVDGAEGYEAQVIREDDAIVVPWIDLGDERRLVLDGLSLVPGQHYVTLVRAYDRSDGRISVEVASDGFRVEDGEVPSVALAAVPDTIFIDPGRGPSWTEIGVSMRDDVALARYRLWIEDSAGSEVRFLEGAEIGGTERAANTVWFGVDAAGEPVPGAIYQVVARAEDGAGGVGSARVEVLVCGPENADAEKCAAPPEAEDEADLGPDAEPAPDVGEDAAQDLLGEPDSADLDSTGDAADAEDPMDLPAATPEGCGCGTQGGATGWAPGIVILGLVARLALKRRRTRAGSG